MSNYSPRTLKKESAIRHAPTQQYDCNYCTALAMLNRSPLWHAPILNNMTVTTALAILNMSLIQHAPTPQYDCNFGLRFSAWISPDQTLPDSYP